MFYAAVLSIVASIGVTFLVGALLDPNIALVGLSVLVLAPFAVSLIGDVMAGELFNPLVALIVVAMVVPVMCLPMHVVAFALLSLWSVLFAALVIKTAWACTRRLSATSATWDAND